MIKCTFSKVSSHFQMKLTKRNKLKSFTGSSLTLLARRAPGRSTGDCKRRSPMPCTHVVERAKNNPVWIKLNELSQNVSFDSEFALAFEIQPFKVPFFAFFLNGIFQSIPVLNGLSKSITLLQKWKNAVFGKFLLFSKWNGQKWTNSNLLLAHH